MEIYNEVLRMLESIYITDAPTDIKSFNGSVSIPNGNVSQNFAESNILVRIFLPRQKAKNKHLLPCRLKK